MQYLIGSKFLPAMSLLLCIGAAAGWARSYFVADRWILNWGGPYGIYYELASAKQAVYYFRTKWQPPSLGKLKVSYESYPITSKTIGPVKDLPSFFGFSFCFTGGPQSRSRELILRIPYWFFVLLAAVPPVCHVVRRIRARRRIAHGRCAMCGYDLRATPERCPECGWTRLL
jgi:hypothetical protein